MSKLCGSVVAFDGAYGLFPGTKSVSSPLEAETVLRTADALGMGCTIHRPSEKWWGGELEKRSMLMQVAAATVDPDDWLLVLDADEILTDVWSGTRTQLAETDRNVAEVSITGNHGGIAPIRRLFRAFPGIGVESTHYTVTAFVGGRKVYLSGDPNVHAMEEALPILDVRIVHREDERDPDRKARKMEYYANAIPQEQRHLYAIDEGGQHGG